jgi:hypothetical protein
MPISLPYFSVQISHFAFILIIRYPSIANSDGQEERVLPDHDQRAPAEVQPFSFGRLTKTKQDQFSFKGIVLQD